MIKEPKQKKGNANTLEPLLDQLRLIPFVLHVETVGIQGRFHDARFDAFVGIQTNTGPFEFLVEIKRSYLDLSVTRAIIARAKQLPEEERLKFLLFARYIPRPTGERLIEAQVNFLDSAGNCHLDLQPHYHWTVLGRREPRRNNESTSRTAASLQVLFTFVAHPESAGWTVRKLAAVAGVSKSKAATARRQFVRNREFRQLERKYWPTDPESLIDGLLAGYRRVLRPQLMFGRFRSPEPNTTRFLQRLKLSSTRSNIQYALTGGPAAFELQRFYKGPETPIFISGVNRDFLKTVRLLPDQRGPVALLRAFGDLVFWRATGRVPITHPWLIYAELMADPHPRAHEAAEQLRSEYLTP